MWHDIFPKIWGDDETDSTPRSFSDEKHVTETHVSKYDSDGESFTSDAQTGVKKIEATTSVWSKSNLIAAYVM